MRYCNRCATERPDNMWGQHIWCRSCRTEYNRDWRAVNPEKHQAAVEARYTREYELRKQVLEALGNKCVRCGFSDVRALQVDHVNGGGLKERASKSRTRFYRDMLTDSTKYQLLCANCNWIKRHEEKETPQLRKGRNHA